MGGIVSSLVTSTACCFGQAALSCCCANLCGATSSIASRVGYSMMFMMTAGLSWLMLTDWAEKKLKDISYGYLDLQCPQGECHGVLAVYRICLATSLFHMIMAAFMYKVRSSRDWRAHVQNGYWAWKLLAWAALIVAAFFLPNGFVMGWGSYIDMPGAAIFILVQVVLLVDFAYTFSETLLAWWEEHEDKRYLALLVSVTFGSYILSLVATIIMYLWFGAPGCQLNQFFISFNLILCIITSVLSAMPQIQEATPKSGLAQASMVTIYATYLVASALVSMPASKDENGVLHCTPPLTNLDNTQTTTLVIGTLFTFLALAYSASRAATRPNFMNESGDGGDRSSHLYAAVESGAFPASALDADDDPDRSHSTPFGTYRPPVDDEVEAVRYSYMLFHLIFVVASMYLAMLVTNWDTVTITKDDFAVVGKSYAAAWVKIVSGWLVLIVYAWTLVAPIILPDRHWD
ncbi:hypothetical protein BATDEDRAFT_37095 [Batrachochytrium dendrobatidis JAM81]|uniref:Serine incorporator/TMS membrane protein n=1 Tax=Batrachochytrium dendrobatidis (strain JAM81 / FGSC 10211) TaxID=684364 RepID=F4P5C1_BATDJ|nr:uncharacterized protein BATDEDRAFT_37095 [Batrachochytrium dendrobatidis JAM81]EGF79388.1 hypothetical protein BATDEDRAFT_37095 [Batrachochytrium dendrobatidis JAM81]|eukprot:XP_006680018.1 hypothetical protein BATDEDRAFT_37095 [Batrachochytrium dendrobatidis JAM81]